MLGAGGGGEYEEKAKEDQRTLRRRLYTVNNIHVKGPSIINKQKGETLLRMSPRVGYNSMAQCEPSITLNTMTVLLNLIFTSLHAALKLVNESTPTIITYSAMQSV